jgi:hypothetical protein
LEQLDFAQIVSEMWATFMSEIEHLRAAARRAERLARNVLDTLTIERLKEATRFYSNQADELEHLRSL